MAKSPSSKTFPCTHVSPAAAAYLFGCKAVSLGLLVLAICLLCGVGGGLVRLPLVIWEGGLEMG